MSLQYDFLGKIHTIGKDELQAIERSGKPHDVRDYAGVGDMGPMHPMAANVWHTPSYRVAELMDARPTPVEGGPVQAAPAITPMPARYGGLLHYCRPMRHSPACGARSKFGYSLSFHRFAPLVDLPRGCDKCKVLWLMDWAERKRKEDKSVHRAASKVRVKKGGGGYVKVMRWTPDEKQRLKRWRKGEPEVGRGGGVVHNSGYGYARTHRPGEL